MMRTTEKLYVYSHMKSNEDESNSANSEKQVLKVYMEYMISKKI